MKSIVEPAEPTTESWAAKATALETGTHAAVETTTHATVNPAAMTAAALSDRRQCQDPNNKEKLRKLSHLR